MKTLVKAWAIILGLLVCISCIDDVTSDVTSNTKPSKPVANEHEGTITASVLFNSEFSTTFTRNHMDAATLQSYYPGEYDVFYFLCTDINNGVYFMEQTGKGNDAVMGDFTIKIRSFWSPADYVGGTNAEVTSHTGEVVYFDIMLAPPFFYSINFPYDKQGLSHYFYVNGGTGKYTGSKGMGEVIFSVDPVTSNIMLHQWKGEIYWEKENN